MLGCIVTARRTAASQNTGLHDHTPFAEANLDEDLATRFVISFSLEIIKRVENLKHLVRICVEPLQLGGRLAEAVSIGRAP